MPLTSYNCKDILATVHISKNVLHLYLVILVGQVEVYMYAIVFHAGVKKKLKSMETKDRACMIYFNCNTGFCIDSKFRKKSGGRLKCSQTFLEYLKSG